MVEIGHNIVLDDSVLSVYEGFEPEWLEGSEEFYTREVGGIHNLSTSDKLMWTRSQGTNALRLIERDTGRQEVWFGHRVNHPQYISLDSDGRFQSHQKFGKYVMPAIHFPVENLIGSNTMRLSLETADFSATTHRTLLSVWCEEGEIHSAPALYTKHDGHAVVSMGMVYRPKDPKVEYIKYFFFERITENWEEGEWKHSVVEDARIIFTKKSLNTTENQKRILKWLGKHCKHGLYPFGEQMFADEEEEFLFVAEFCT